MTDASIPFERSGRVLITGPSNAGKSRLTARALDAWLADKGPRGVVVFEFAPELERDGRVLGGRLSRFVAIPEAIHYGRIDAHAPRAEGDSPEETVALARENAVRARTALAAAPTEPAAVFVNDATIPFQHEAGDLSAFLAMIENATYVVANAFASDELGIDDSVSSRELMALTALEDWADHHVRLGKDDSENA